ncbi:hypothetical protein [Methanogenium cariaci]|jgi:small nuclear ribonucleoprotein (snRNP)-like protein|uniref:hypothetical protein n=1 Tax=Methanogenium cariaci TaxID=2197 RepID=UPI000785D32C|nr:hypothetical protein [Methanogenium cariaci]
MAGFDDYMNTYLDRRMKDIIGEWNLGTMQDLGDYQIRLRQVENDIQEMGHFTQDADAKLTDMEQRLEKVREGKK